MKNSINYGWHIGQIKLLAGSEHMLKLYLYSGFYVVFEYGELLICLLKTFLIYNVYAIVKNYCEHYNICAQ